MKLMISFVALFVCVTAGTAEENPGRVQLKPQGFSIAALEGESDSQAYEALKMSIPSTKGMTPSVNVVIQPYDGTIEEYVEISKAQFRASNLNLIRVRVEGVVARLEYKGVKQKRKLRWYSRAIQGRGKIYLVTGTALSSEWSKVSSKLKVCVDSFKLEQATPDGSDRSDTP